VRRTARAARAGEPGVELCVELICMVSHLIGRAHEAA